jgi:prepilin peptidase CpaA
MVVQAIHLALLMALLGVAAAADVAERRVPNAVVAPLAAAGLAAQWAEGGAPSALLGAIAGGLLLALLLLPWTAGKLGGGDAKLAAAAAVWLGPGRLLPFVLFTAVAGAPVALAARLGHRLELRRLLRQAAAGGVPAEGLAPPAQTVPVAVAVALGAFAALRWNLP